MNGTGGRRGAMGGNPGLLEDQVGRDGRAHSFVGDMTINGWVNGGGEGRKVEADTRVISHEGAARIFAMAEDGI